MGLQCKCANLHQHLQKKKNIFSDLGSWASKVFFTKDQSVLRKCSVTDLEIRSTREGG